MVREHLSKEGRYGWRYEGSVRENQNIESGQGCVALQQDSKWGIRETKRGLGHLVEEREAGNGADEY